MSQVNRTPISRPSVSCTVGNLTERHAAGLARRFWPKVDQSAGAAQCWEWTAARSSSGYGSIGLGGRRAGMAYAHRVSFYFAFGFWPPEHTDHLCRNKGCVNPAHLEAVSPLVNIRRARPAVCANGHPMCGPNILLVNDRARRYPMRRCRTCWNAKIARRRSVINGKSWTHLPPAVRTTA